MRITLIVNSLITLQVVAMCCRQIFRRSSTVASNKSMITTFQEANMFGYKVIIKRDDLFSFPGLSTIHGNKARKLHALYYDQTFPNSVVSYGGVQSNSMRSLALLCQHKGGRFVYLSKALPSILISNPFGNYLDAANAGMKLIALGEDDYNTLPNCRSAEGLALNIRSKIDPSCDEAKFAKEWTFISQGAAMQTAQSGIYTLCAEMAAFLDGQPADQTWKIVFASGTGISAFFAAQYFHKHPKYRGRVTIVAVPCVASTEVLESDLQKLQERLCDSSSSATLPKVLSTHNAPKRYFAKPYVEHLRIWESLQEQSGIVFDLIYAPRAWEILLSQKTDIFTKDRVLYYHCGGLEGNPSQLARYRRAGMLGPKS